MVPFFDSDPMGFITAPKAQLYTKPAPFMASFSSKGPNIVTPEILKVRPGNLLCFPFLVFPLYHCVIDHLWVDIQHDLTAPGVNIIAAYSQATSPTDEEFDKRRSAFNTESGTSMSCPHVAGVVGLLKTVHPDWSPAAIRSAIITTGKHFSQPNVDMVLHVI